MLLFSARQVAKGWLTSLLLISFGLLLTACQGGSVAKWQTYVAEGGLITPVAAGPVVASIAGSEAGSVVVAAPSSVEDDGSESSDVPAQDAPPADSADALSAPSVLAETTDFENSMVVSRPSNSLAAAPRPTVDPLAPPPLDLHTTKNILILGTDTQLGERVWRTDSIMVLGLDYQYRRAALLSIPRDLLVEIPDVGWRRINQVDYMGERVLNVDGGGPALFSQVLSNTLGIQTEHWIRADMDGFREFVDILGGVTVHLDCPYYELYKNDNTNEYFWYRLPAGDILMDGDTAFMFVRLRYLNTDSGRSLRQRQFLWALRDQAMSTNLLPKIPDLWRLMRNNFATDLSLFQMLELGNFGLSLDANNVRAGAITVKDLERYITSSGADVLRIADPARIQAIIDGIWDAPPLSEAGTAEGGVCPPAPSNLPDYLILPTPTPTPEEMAASASNAITPEETASEAVVDPTPVPVVEAAPQAPADEEPTSAGASGSGPEEAAPDAIPAVATVEPTPSAPSLEPGMKVEVANTGGRSIRLRSLPSVTSEILDAYRMGEVLDILVPGDDYVSYPVNEDNYLWVRVRAWDGTIGWIAQQYLRPIQDAAGADPGDATSAVPGDASP